MEVALESPEAAEKQKEAEAEKEAKEGKLSEERQALPALKPSPVDMEVSIEDLEGKQYLMVSPVLAFMAIYEFSRSPVVRVHVWICVRLYGCAYVYFGWFVCTCMRPSCRRRALGSG